MLTQPEHCREVARLTDLEAQIWRAGLPPTPEDDQANANAYAAICFTVHHAHQHLLENSGNLAAVAWARLTEKFNPTDNASMHQLNSSLQQASIEKFNHDVDAYYSRFVAICGRLASANQPVSEQMQITLKTCVEQLRDLLCATRTRKRQRVTRVSR
mmetsp:Transcript_34731/g.48354  ORF Transcript_34731/g.48354 Transcript_34731/m.48354 type:complete len:157 (+) Transcript_34731:273-743(+)